MPRSVTIYVSPPTSSLLTWAPPDTTGYTIINIDGPTRTPSNNRWDLTDNTDYVIDIDGVSPVGLDIRGGRNIVIIGGEFEVTQKWPNEDGDGSSEEFQGAIIFRDSQTALNPGRVIHVEGVYGHGYYFSDGIRVAASSTEPPAEPDVRVQNCRFEQGMWGRTTGEGPGTHPDVIQPYGGCSALRIDRLTGVTTYQGLLLYTDRGPTGEKWVRNMNLRNQDPDNTAVEYGDPLAPTPRPANYFDSRPNSLVNWGVHDGGDWRIDTGTIWLDHYNRVMIGTSPNGRLISTSSGLQASTDEVGTYNYYDAGTTSKWKDWAGVSGQAARMYEGDPPGGDYCPATVPGAGYVSPGYL
jgi:hypothetical protein